MSVMFIKKVYINPFAEYSEPVMKIEIVKVERIYRYTRRKRSDGKPNYEVMYNIIRFDLHGSSLQDSLKKWNLNLWEYLDLLSKESPEIKEKYNYYCSDTSVISFHYSMVDAIVGNDIYLMKLMGKILSELGVPYTIDNDKAIRSVIEDAPIDKDRLDAFNECVQTPYLRKR